MPTPDIASNKATVERLCAAANTGDLALISALVDEIAAPDLRMSTPLPGAATGPDRLKHVWATLFRAFPDLRLSVQDLIGEGDKVVVRNVVRGTHRGDYLGLPGSGTVVTYDEIFIFRFTDGRISEISGVVDLAAQLRQLGLLSAV
ncbi:MAG TPA: ester cyclase [Mycobacteriales bacterium]